MPFNFRPTALKIAQRNKVDPAERKTVVITGASSGIGLAAATALAQTGWRVICAVRSVDKMNKHIQSLSLAPGSGSIESMELDLTSFDSVRAFAAALLNREDVPKINALVLNAGLVIRWGVSKDGYEQAFQTCHLSHHLLLRLLEDRLVASAPSRVVIVSSAAHRAAGKYDWPSEGRKGFRSDSAWGFNPMAQYAASKLANIHLAVIFAKRMKGKDVSITTHHPGAVNSSIWPKWVIGRSLYMLSVDQGASTLVFQVTDPRFGGKDLPVTYWNPSMFGLPHKLSMSRYAKNEKVAQELWDVTERIVFPSVDIKAD